MSGGIAYLFNDGKNFDQNKFNLEMVELEDLNEQDKETLFNLISNHFKYTKSKKAKNILNLWPEKVKNFIKVMPTDYKRALEILAKEATKEKE
jgi:glutamate synthase (ferredoxin)